MKLFMAIVAGLIAITYACKDNYSPYYCKKFKERGSCKYSKNIRINLCPKTCDACDEVPTVPTTTQEFRITRTGIPRTPGVHTCGTKMVSISRVIGGSDAPRGAWPWQILLKKSGRPNCGGTIINKRYIVTAAHCLSLGHPKYYTVVTGETDRTLQEGSEKEYKVKILQIAPKYNRYTKVHDIAVLKVDRDIEFNRYVQPACMPSGDVPVGSNCFITGFGRSENSRGMNTKLQQAFLSPVDNKVCYEYNKKNGVNVLIQPGMICGGDGGNSTRSGCHGDSGGPYVCEINGVWELHGAVSFGSSRCDSKQTYSVFARVNFYKRWIQSVMEDYGM